MLSEHASISIIIKSSLFFILFQFYVIRMGIPATHFELGGSGSLRGGLYLDGLRRAGEQRKEVVGIESRTYGRALGVEQDTTTRTRHSTYKSQLAYFSNRAAAHHR